MDELEIKKIIDERKITALLKLTRRPTTKKVQAVLNKALKKGGLSLKEVSCLLNADSPALLKKMFAAAGKIKREIYGERLVFFAPLYVSSYCINDCDYCGFHRRNLAPRKKLSLAEVAEQVKILEDMGHKRLLVEFGEDPINNPIDYVVKAIRTIYATKSGQGEIRRVNVNLAATTVKNYRRLKKAGIGTYQLFQETYHRKTFEKVHHGPKANYARQLLAHNRAMTAGLDDVGLGVLFGLYNYKFDVLGLVAHAQYLENKFGVGPHTFSVPRWRPAATVDLNPAYQVSEPELLKIIAILRLAVPYTGMIISTRERPKLRAKAFKIGISQTSAASKTAPGGYSHNEPVKQFDTFDQRSLDETLKSILKQGLLPSFCTACYRLGRTGQTFMDLAKPGDIQNLCRPNAILTFKEYLEDYASSSVKILGQKIIKQYLQGIPSKKTRLETAARLARIENGRRDLYF